MTRAIVLASTFDVVSFAKVLQDAKGDAKHLKVAISNLLLRGPKRCELDILEG